MDKLFAVIVAAAFIIFVVVAVTEWMVGCGETYVDAAGVRHQYTCAFITQRR